MLVVMEHPGGTSGLLRHSVEGRRYIYLHYNQMFHWKGPGCWKMFEATLFEYNILNMLFCSNKRQFTTPPLTSCLLGHMPTKLATSVGTGGLTSFYSLKSEKQAIFTYTNKMSAASISIMGFLRKTILVL